MSLRDAAKILANGTHRIGVSGRVPVEPWQVEQIAKEWLELTESAACAKAPKKPSLLRRLFSNGGSGQ